MLDLSLKTLAEASTLRIGLAEHRAIEFGNKFAYMSFSELATLGQIFQTVRVTRRVDRDHQEARLVHLREYSRP